MKFLGKLLIFCVLSCQLGNASDLSIENKAKVEDTSLYFLLEHTQEMLSVDIPVSIKKEKVPAELQKIQLLKDAVAKAITLQGEIFTAFSSNTIFYNPELAHAFYTTCTLLDNVTEAQAFQPKHIRMLRENAEHGAKYFARYLVSRKIFLKDQDMTFLQSVVIFYQLLCGIYHDEYRMFGVAQRISDYCIHRPWEFACENPEIVVIAVAVAGFAAWYYWVGPWLEKRNREYDLDQITVVRQKGLRCGEHALLNSFIAANCSATETEEIHKYLRANPDRINDFLNATKMIIFAKRSENVANFINPLLQETKKQMLDIRGEITQLSSQLADLDPTPLLGCLFEETVVQEGVAPSKDFKDKEKELSKKKAALEQLNEDSRDDLLEVRLEKEKNSDLAKGEYLTVAMNDETVKEQATALLNTVRREIANDRIEQINNEQGLTIQTKTNQIQQINQRLEEQRLTRQSLAVPKVLTQEQINVQDQAFVVNIPGHWISVKAIPGEQYKKGFRFIVYDSTNGARISDQDVLRQLATITAKKTLLNQKSS